MTSPSDHIALFELLWWTSLEICDSKNDPFISGIPPNGEMDMIAPELSDALLRTAREQLLTTRDLWHEFIAGLEKLSCERLGPTHGYYDFGRVALSASAANQAAVLVGMRESFKK